MPGLRTAASKPDSTPNHQQPLPIAGLYDSVSRMHRLGNLILDRIVMVVAAATIYTVLFLGWGWDGRGAQKYDLDAVAIATCVLTYLFEFVYYLVLEWKLQQTVGKMFTETIVVGPWGLKPTFGQILLRTFCRYIPFEPLSFFIGPRGWHDFLSVTSVVKK